MKVHEQKQVSTFHSNKSCIVEVSFLNEEQNWFEFYTSMRSDWLRV